MSRAPSNQEPIYAHINQAYKNENEMYEQSKSECSGSEIPRP
jgi:hypothetical protein